MESEVVGIAVVVMVVVVMMLEVERVVVKAGVSPGARVRSRETVATMKRR